MTRGGGRADYSRLTAALAGRPGSVVTLSWAELDAIVGGLPRSAVDHYPQWWHGDRPNTRAWRAAGFELDGVDVGRWVRFRRTGAAAGAGVRTPVRAASPRGSSGVPVDVLRGVDPRTALLVVACSAAKRHGGVRASAGAAGWPAELTAARAVVLRTADLDDRLVMPAWQRYEGAFHRAAHDALAEAVTVGNVVILSGGYGVLRADEPIGWYNKMLRVGDWPDGLLESLLVREARRVGAGVVVGFLGGSTDYARLLRRSRWHDAGTEALLVTMTGVSGGAMTEVPRRRGLASTAFWNRRHDGYPDGTTVERLG